MTNAALKRVCCCSRMGSGYTCAVIFYLLLLMRHREMAKMNWMQKTRGKKVLTIAQNLLDQMLIRFTTPIMAVVFHRVNGILETGYPIPILPHLFSKCRSKA